LGVPQRALHVVHRKTKDQFQEVRISKYIEEDDKLVDEKSIPSFFSWIFELYSQTKIS
jgi:NRPS condensation-like uncharacterized protein